MYCSGCGQALEAGQIVCSKCGRPLAPTLPPVPGLQFQLENYAGKIRLLGICWFVYAGLALITGLAGLTFAKAFLGGNFAPWMHGPWGNDRIPWIGVGPVIAQFIWFKLILRVGLALAAGWGLLEHTRWGRLVAIVAAVISMAHLLLGTAMAIWTLVMLLGYRNSSLYEQL